MLDFLAIAVADLASISERRTDRFLDKSRSGGLNAFLAADPGVDSGHMIAQYTQAAIVSELKRLAVPASVDSIPSSAMQEDHVSMGWSAARKLRRGIDGLTRVLAVELRRPRGGLELRLPLHLHPLLPPSAQLAQRRTPPPPIAARPKSIRCRVITTGPSSRPPVGDRPSMITTSRAASVGIARAAPDKRRLQTWKAPDRCAHPAAPR